MSVNVTDYAEIDAHQNGWESKGWWCGWIGERVLVIPLGDSGTHVSPHCRCNPTAEIINGTAMLVHNAFDERQKFEA